MTPETGTGQRHGYATAVAGLWRGLAQTLSRLDELARDPEAELADEQAVEELPRLQYALHRAAELVYGLEPPEDAAGQHVELAAALEEARDATAEIAAALETGGTGAASSLVHEWRGALFRVRLARMRLAGPPAARPAAPPPAGEGTVAAPLAAFLLALVGAIAFAAGATLGFWPLWTGGIGCVVLALAVYRP